MAKSIEEVIKARYLDCTLDHYTIDGESIDIYLTSNVISGRCPCCKELVKSVHCRYVKKFADVPVAAKFTTVHLTLRMLCCRNDSHDKVFFAARHIFLGDPEAKKTDRLVKKILDIASKNTVRGTVEVCKANHIKCDKNTVSRLLKDNKMRKCDLDG